MNLSKQSAIRTAHWFPRCFKCNKVMYVKDTDTPLSEECWRGLNMECNKCCEGKLEEKRRKRIEDQIKDLMGVQV